jgi:hypothetical protein
VLTFALGALGGLAIGLLLSRRGVPAGRERMDRLGSGLRERARTVGEHARTVARRLRPARMRRMALEQEELTQLEELSERAVDIGAISPGIVELSGSVRSEAEADRAVHAANAIEGVRTVVNRLDVESEARAARRAGAEGEAEGREWTGRNGGMSRRRQGRQTDPDQSDDAQPQTEKALRDADLAQYGDEDLAHGQPAVQRRPDAASDPWRTNFSEDELDNQDPHGKHAAYTLDEPPQELNSASRVGEGLKSGEHLILEQADVPVKPHGGKSAGGEGRESGKG